MQHPCCRRALRPGSPFVPLMLVLLLAIVPAAAWADMTIGSNFWFVFPDQPGTYPFAANARFAAYPNHGDVWRPEFIAEMAPYKVLRFMDWGCTNNQTVVNWADRILPTNPAQKVDCNNQIEYYWDNSRKVFAKSPNPGQSSRGIAYEYMIELCNRLNKDIWICVPHKASDDYVTQLANLLKTKVNSNLKIYIEYSNECWNTMFDQRPYCEEQGIARGLAPDVYSAGQKFYGLRVGQIMKIFCTQFAGQTGRLVRVLAGPAFDTWSLEKAYSQIAGTGGAVDAVAIGAYFGDKLDGRDPNLFTSGQGLYAAIDTMEANYVAASENWAKGKKLRFFAYEGGQHLLANAHIANRDPRMYAVYQYYLNRMSGHFELLNHYAHASYYGYYTGWGAKEGIGQADTAANKYRAIKDWVRAPDRSSGHRD